MLKLPSSHPTSIKPHFHLNKNRSLLLCTILLYSQLSRSQPCLSSLCLPLWSLVTSLNTITKKIHHSPRWRSWQQTTECHSFLFLTDIGIRGLPPAVIIKETNQVWTLLSKWVQEIGVIANKALTDWYNVKASFCISDPAKCKRWGWVTVGEGPPPEWSGNTELDAAPIKK